MTTRSKFWRVTTVALLLYAGSYIFAYAFRPHDAVANGAYFAYTKLPAAASVERALYYFYWPIYKVHRVFGAQRHNFDRDPPVDDPNA